MEDEEEEGREGEGLSGVAVTAEVGEVREVRAEGDFWGIAGELEGVVSGGGSGRVLAWMF